MKLRTFEKIYLRTDRMGGLRLETRDNPTQKYTDHLLLQGWDSTHVPEVTGELRQMDDKVLWEGVVYTRDQIAGIFKPNDGLDSSCPRTYATRKGSLVRPATVGVIRAASADGETFDIQVCNGGEEVQRILTSLKLFALTVLLLSNGRKKYGKPLFDPSSPVHLKRVQKLKNAGAELVV